MSVTTTADTALDHARDHIREAIKHLSTIVVDRCWGHDEFSEEYRTKIRETFQQLLKLRAELD